MSPIFPYITDFKAIIEKTRAYADEYWFENLNLRAGYKTEKGQRLLDTIRKRNRCLLYSRRFNLSELLLS